MTGFELLYATKFVYDLASTAQQHQQINDQSAASYQNALKQVSANNQSNVNAHLGVNAEMALNLKKHGLDKWELWKQKRRQEAAQAVKSESRGMKFGSARDAGGTFQAAMNNVSRQAYSALARKDLNMELAIDDFGRRHDNLDLATINSNNQAFSQISEGASFLASALSIAGSGIQTGIDMDRGTRAPTLKGGSTAAPKAPAPQPSSSPLFAPSSYGGGASRGLTG